MNKYDVIYAEGEFETVMADWFAVDAPSGKPCYVFFVETDGKPQLVAVFPMSAVWWVVRRYAE